MLAIFLLCVWLLQNLRGCTLRWAICHQSHLLHKLARSAMTKMHADKISWCCFFLKKTQITWLLVTTSLRVQSNIFLKKSVVERKMKDWIESAKKSDSLLNLIEIDHLNELKDFQWRKKTPLSKIGPKILTIKINWNLYPYLCFNKTRM